MCTFINATENLLSDGGVAQMVERSLSMREVPGSMPGTSTFFSVLLQNAPLKFYLSLQSSFK